MIFRDIAAELPPIFDFRGKEPVAHAQVLPKDPLCVTTILYEDDVGALRAIVTEEDKLWARERDEARDQFDPS